jgi:hypothetical protein
VRASRGPGACRTRPWAHQRPSPGSCAPPCLPSLRRGRATVADLAEAEFASGRGTERLLRVARTIADLDGAVGVDVAHLEEAAWYRSPILKQAALAS